MIIIDTKQMRNGNWNSYATINGYDVNYQRQTIESAQQRMSQKLASVGINEGDVRWNNPVPYEAPEKLPKPPIGYAKNRIDNL